MSPSGFRVDHEAQTDVGKCRVGDTAEKIGDNTNTQSSVENHGGPSCKLWPVYINGAKTENDQITRKWTEDMGGVLVFIGLFSTVVTAFILENYKKLSPDSGDQSLALLTQLVNISTRAPVVVQSSPPFKPPVYVVRVNMMWSLSLFLSLSCALLATLMQQWARNHLEYTQYRGLPREQARIRAYMFDGVKTFGFPKTVEVLPLEMHLSVFLFLAGLVDFFLHINEVLASSVLVLSMTLVLIYAQCTILPFLVPNSPCRTPLSDIIWTSWRPRRLSSLSVEFLSYEYLLNIWRQWRVKPTAMKAPPEIDARATYRTLTTLDEYTQLGDFAACIPGSFDPRAAPDVTPAMLPFMSGRPTSDPILGPRLYELLKSSQPGTSRLTEPQPKDCLHTCLKGLWYFLRAYNRPGNSKLPLSPSVRAVFASPKVIHWIQTESDFATRLLGRCFWSLTVKKLADGVTLSHRTSIASITTELSCLSYILGTTDEQVGDWLQREGAIDLANVISLASGEMEIRSGSSEKGFPQVTVTLVISRLTRWLGSIRYIPNSQMHEFPTDSRNRCGAYRINCHPNCHPSSSLVEEENMVIPGPEPKTAPYLLSCTL